MSKLRLRAQRILPARDVVAMVQVGVRPRGRVWRPLPRRTRARHRRLRHPTHRAPSPDADSAAGLDRQSGGAGAAPGPDAQPRHRAPRAPTQRVPGHDTESAGARHRERESARRAPPEPETDAAGARHERQGPTQRAPGCDRERRENCPQDVLSRGGGRGCWRSSCPSEAGVGTKGLLSLGSALAAAERGTPFVPHPAPADHEP